MGILDIFKSGIGVYGYVAVGAILLGTHGATAYYAYDAGKDSIKTDLYESQIESMSDKIVEIVLQNERYQDSVIKLQSKIDQTKTLSRTVIKRVEKEIEKPVYKNCTLPSSGVRVLRESIDRFNSSRISSGASTEMRSDTAD